MTSWNLGLEVSEAAMPQPRNFCSVFQICFKRPEGLYCICHIKTVVFHAEEEASKWEGNNFKTRTLENN